MSAGHILNEPELSNLLRINWSQVVREIMPKAVREVGVAMWTFPPEIDIVFESMGYKHLWESEARDRLKENEDLRILLEVAKIDKSVYHPPSFNAG